MIMVNKELTPQEYFYENWYFRNRYKNNYACKAGAFDVRYYCEEGLIINPFMKEHPEYKMKMDTISIRNLAELEEDLLEPITEEEVNKMKQNVDDYNEMSYFSKIMGEIK